MTWGATAHSGARRFIVRLRSCWAGLAAGLILYTAPAAAQSRKPPYWASISSGQAMMRTGPGRNYPGIWLYQRRDLPIRVVRVYENWRMIEDPDGTRGWMLVTLLSDRRTAIVKPGDPRPIRSQPSPGAPIAYRAEAGVVGRIDKCRIGWCQIEVGSKRGFIRAEDVWGLSPGEILE